MLKVKEWKVGEVFYFVETGKNADFKLLPHYGIEVKGHTVSKVLKEPYGKVITIFDENETVYDLEAWKEQLFKLLRKQSAMQRQKSRKWMLSMQVFRH